MFSDWGKEEISTAPSIRTIPVRRSGEKSVVPFRAETSSVKIGAILSSIAAFTGERYFWAVNCERKAKRVGNRRMQQNT